MRAVVYDSLTRSISLAHSEVPKPAAGQVLARVLACGVCRTDLHLVDGELSHPKRPIVPGHEVVAEVVEGGSGVEFRSGMRVGIPWLGWTCDTCWFCRHGQENLCVKARFTGYTLDGGYAEYLCADACYCFEIPAKFDDIHAAPLLCAGLIGYRSYRMTGDAHKIGIYGFGAAAHILTQVAIYQKKSIFAFVRPGDDQAKASVAGATTSERGQPNQTRWARIFAARRGGRCAYARRRIAFGSSESSAGAIASRRRSGSFRAQPQAYRAHLVPRMLCPW